MYAAQAESELTMHLAPHRIATYMYTLDSLLEGMHYIVLARALGDDRINTAFKFSHKTQQKPLRKTKSCA